MASILNKGRLINFINGITGVSAGGQAVVNMPVNSRYHRLILQCKAINYKGGTAQKTTHLTGVGDDALTVTPTISNGVITSLAVIAGGTGYVTGDTITTTDATGKGFVGTVTALAGVVTDIAVTVKGVATAISPASFFTGVKLLVNGVNMRDIDASNIIRIAMANGYYPRLGELPIMFTPPWRNVNPQNELTSWDLFGQSTFQIQLSIAPGLELVSLSGIQEFDYMRNIRPDAKGNAIPFLQPTAQHQFSWPIVAGRNDINTLPYDFPISRMWLRGSSPGNISQLEVFQDGNKAAEFTIEQLKQAYNEYGFTFGKPDLLNMTHATNPALAANYEPPIYFDAAFIADPDQRWFKALKCANQMILRVYSDVAQTLTIVQETLPGSFAS